MTSPDCEVVVAGASAGGVEALISFVRSLPARFGPAVIIVLHVAPAGTSALNAILQRVTSLPVVLPQDREPLLGGHVYVAPADHHLLIEDGCVCLNRGPRENGFRPAIDPSMRSAAAECGSGATGVVLSGTRDDGTAGLAAIKAAGGCAIVQDPEEALYDGMPRSAIAQVDVDAVLPVAEIGAFIGGVAASPNGREAPMKAPGNPGSEQEATRFTCPDCGGVLYEHRDGELFRYACSVGHAYSADSLLEAQDRTVEDALWTAVRSLEDRAAFFERLAERAEGSGNGRAAAHFRTRRDDCVDKALEIRRACGFPVEDSLESTG